MRFLKNTGLWSAAFWLWLIVLVVLTSLPGGNSPEKFSGSSFRWDYLEHFGLYLIIPVLYRISDGKALKPLSSANPNRLLVAGGIIFAVITETYQLWIPGRAFNPVDMMLNITGFLTGYFAVHLVKSTGTT